jgi:hypothetical protein
MPTPNRSFEPTALGKASVCGSTSTLSLSIIWTASIGSVKDGKEIDIHEGDKKQSSDGQNGARSD